MSLSAIDEAALDEYYDTTLRRLHFLTLRKLFMLAAYRYFIVAMIRPACFITRSDALLKRHEIEYGKARAGFDIHAIFNSCRHRLSPYQCDTFAASVYAEIMRQLASTRQYAVAILKCGLIAMLGAAGAASALV